MGQVDEDAAWVAMSPHRTKVLGRLMEGNALPSQIKEDTDQEYSRISEALKSLRNRELVELLVDENQKRGRLHGVTDRGEDAWRYMERQKMV